LALAGAAVVVVVVDPAAVVVVVVVVVLDVVCDETSTADAAMTATSSDTPTCLTPKQ
jgi:hypothetical protein